MYGRVYVGPWFEEWTLRHDHLGRQTLCAARGAAEGGQKGSKKGQKVEKTPKKGDFPHFLTLF